MRCGAAGMGLGAAGMEPGAASMLLGAAGMFLGAAGMELGAAGKSKVTGEIKGDRKSKVTSTECHWIKPFCSVIYGTF